MEDRVEGRRKDFKKAIDDPLRQREDTQIQIRKARRDAQIFKRRMQPGLEAGGAMAAGGLQGAGQELGGLSNNNMNGVMGGGNMGVGNMSAGNMGGGNMGGGMDGGMEGEGGMGGEEEMGGVREGKDIGVSLADLPELAVAIRSDDPVNNFTATQQIRRLLSVEKQPPIQAVIDGGLVPRFVEMLDWDQRPDLQFEAAWALTNIASGTREQTAAVMEAGGIAKFVRLLNTPRLDVREQSIWALGNIAGDSPEFRDAVLQQGAMKLLLEELKSADQQGTKLSIVRYATWTLSNFCRGKPEPPFEAVSCALPVLRSLLYAVDTEILTDACWAINYLSDAGDESSSKCIDAVIHSGVCTRLVELLTHQSYLVQTPALRAIGNIVTGDDNQTGSMIAFGCLPRLKQLLSSHRRALRKEACWALSNITAGSSEQIEEVISAGIITDLVKLLDRDDFEVRREAAWAISNAASGGNIRQISALVESGCIRPLVALLDVHDHRIVGVALEAIENILRTGKTRMEEESLPENPYIDELDVAGGLSKLERFQYHAPKSKLHTLSVRILENYFDVEEEIEPAVQMPTEAPAQAAESLGFGGMT